MISLLPTKSQWKSWSKPTKYEFIGLIVAILALLNVPALVDRVFQPEPADDYAQLRARYVSKLEAANACLTARLYFDTLHPLETECIIDISGLRRFSHNFAPYMAVTPYSGAWNLERYAASVEETVTAINNTKSHAELVALQRRTPINFAEIAYYICGIEWYIRMGPPEEMSPMSAKRVATYQASWLGWIHENGGKFRDVSFTYDQFEVKDDKDCSSFIDLLD